MATKAQIEANRRNAQKSTGPTSAAGKAKCAGNRSYHGLCSSQLLVDWETSEEFNALRDDLHAEYQPATRTEVILVDRMVINQWNVERSFALQALTMRAGFASDYPQVKHIVPDLALLLRYQTTGEKGFDKARNELLTLQEQRKKSEIGSESQNLPEALAEPSTEASPEPAPIPAVAPLHTPDLDQMSGTCPPEERVFKKAA
jgi:hypothetical protein